MVYNVFVDGSVRDGNPGIASIAVYVNRDGKDVYRHSWLLPMKATSNEAEYEAVLAGIEYLKTANESYKLDREECFIITDSQLVYGHVVKGWKCNFEYLRKLRDYVIEQLKSLPFTVHIKQMGRENNEVANKLAQDTTLKAKKERTKVSERI